MPKPDYRVLGNFFTRRASYWNTRNFREFSNLYSKDAIFIHPLGVCIGREAIYQLLSNELDVNLGFIKYDTSEIVTIAAMRDTSSVETRWLLQYRIWYMDMEEEYKATTELNILGRGGIHLIIQECCVPNEVVDDGSP